MNISDYLRTALLNHAMNVVTYTPPATVYAGLYLVAPTSAGGGTEVTASDYARVSAAWGTASLGDIQTNAQIRFPASGNTLSSWGTITTLGLFDAVTAGNLLWFGSLSAPQVLNLGTFFTLAVGGLTITLS